MTTEAASAANIRHRMITLAKKGRFDQVEELWLEFIAGAPDDPELFTHILRQVAHSKAGETGHTMLLLLLEQWKERDRWDVVHDIATGLAAAWPQSAELRAITIEALKHKHGHLPQFPSMLKGSGIERGAPLGEAVDKFLFFLRALPGQCYRYAGKGVGIVVAADFERDKVTLDFPREKGRTFTTGGVREFLIYLPPDHFLALRATNPESLAALADKEPAELVRLVAQSQGGRIKQGDMKEMLLDGVFDAAKWNSWWTKARAALKVDPMIEFAGTGGAHAEIIVRAVPKTLNEEIEERFFSTRTARLHQIAEIKNLESVKASAPPDPALVRRMLAYLEQQFAKAAVANDTAGRVELALMAHDLRALSPEAAEQAGGAIPLIGDVISGVEDYTFLGAMESDDMAVRALDLLTTRDGEAALGRMAAALPHVPSKVAQAMWRDLGDPARKVLCYPALKRLLAAPMQRPDTYLWVVKGLVDQRWPHLNDYFPLSTLVPELLDLIDEWAVFVEKVQGSVEQVRVAKTLISRAKSMLKADQCQAIFNVGMMMSYKQMDELERQMSRHASLDNDLRSDAIRRLGSARRVRDEQAVAAGELDEIAAPAEPALTAPPQAPGLTDDIIHYCTSQARDRKVLELQKLRQETIPENTRLMEEARQEGDLRENAAYHAAKERHKFLGNLSAQLQTQIQNASVFEAGMVNTDVIGFGVRFTVHNETTDAEETYTVLGRWEADTDRHILNYQAPFVQQFIGKGVGQTVAVLRADGSGEPTPYRVLLIENALLLPEWGGVPAPAPAPVPAS